MKLKWSTPSVCGKQGHTSTWHSKRFNGLSALTVFLLMFLLLASCQNPSSQKENEKGEETSRVPNLPYFNDPSFTPHWLTPGSEEVKSFHAIPDFTLFNQLGDTVTAKTFDNKIYVADFFFTICPGICPKMTDNMTKLQEAFKDDSNVLLLSHSVTPDYDSVPVLKAYAEDKGIRSDKWHLVTGSQKEIYDLGRNHYFVEENLGVAKSEQDFLHTENFVLIDHQKHIRGIYNGLNKASIAQLIIDIRTLKSEL